VAVKIDGSDLKDRLEEAEIFRKEGYHCRYTHGALLPFISRSSLRFLH